MIATNKTLNIKSAVSRRQVLIGGAGAGAVALSGRYAHAAAGEWPSRVVKMISPYGAGSSNDISLRILSEYVGQKVDQQFVVENKPGAGTRIANEFVAHAVADGYRFFMRLRLTSRRKPCSASSTMSEASSVPSPWPCSHRCF